MHEARLPPADDVSDLSLGELVREVMFFAAVVGACAGVGYGLFLGYQDWQRVVADTTARKSFWVVPGWGLIWGVGGALASGLACGALVLGVSAALGGLRRLFKK